RDRGERRRHEGLLLRALRQSGQRSQDDPGAQGQESLPGRPQLDFGQQRAALRHEQDGHRSGGVLRQGGLFRQPRERGDRAGAGHLRCRLQLVERREGIEPVAHGAQGHGESRRFPHHLQVRPDREFTDGLSVGAAARSQGRDQEGRAGAACQGPRRLRQDLRGQAASLRRGRPQGLRAGGRDHQVRRRAAQEEEVVLSEPEQARRRARSRRRVRRRDAPPMRPASSVRLPPEQLARAQAAYAAAIAAKRARLALGAVCLLIAIALAGVAGEVDLGKFLANIDRFPNYIRGLVPSLSWANLPPHRAEWFWNLDEWLKQLADTLLIAYLGTLLGALGAFVLCFSACANLEHRGVVRFVARRFLEFCRTVPEIVFALLFVVAFGLGAMPG